MRPNPFLNAALAHITLAVALAIKRVDLWVSVHVVYTLDVAYHHLFLAVLIGEVRKCLRSVPHELHFGIARVLPPVLRTAAHSTIQSSDTNFCMRSVLR